jgi:hypothetical protein
MKASVLGNVEIATGFATWEAYANWYAKNGDVPVYPEAERWPVILSSSDEETLDDGWHRMHAYIASEHLTVPAVFFLTP